MSHTESRIVSYHAHIYYDPATTRETAADVRDGISERFVVQLGRWHDGPVGPHTQAMSPLVLVAGRMSSRVFAPKAVALTWLP